MKKASVLFAEGSRSPTSETGCTFALSASERIGFLVAGGFLIGHGMNQRQGPRIRLIATAENAQVT
jgi:hypothetical protein